MKHDSFRNQLMYGQIFIKARLLLVTQKKKKGNLITRPLVQMTPHLRVFYLSANIFFFLWFHR